MLVTAKVCVPLLYPWGYGAMLVVNVVHRCHSQGGLLVPWLLWKFA